MNRDAPVGRLIIANLDCESELAGGGPGAPDLNRRAREAISAAATLLRALAGRGDRLWLPGAVPPEAMLEVPGLPRPALETGPLADVVGADDVLAWGETETVARIRSRARSRSPARRPEGTDRLGGGLPGAAAEAAAAVNHRRYLLPIADELGCRLPGARMVASPRDLRDHLRNGGAHAGWRHRWVLKAPFSAAGRRRYIHRGTDAGANRRIARLFERHGALLFEPWMERTADFGAAALVTPEGLSVVGRHRLSVDRDGRFTGLELIVGGPRCEPPDPWLEEAERAAFDRALERTARRLGETGYRGPFGIDCWRYRRSDGRRGFHPLGEINGRMTFGLVARELVDRLRRPLGLALEARVRLVFGTRCPALRGHDIVPLFESAPPAPRAIWLEIRRGRRPPP